MIIQLTQSELKELTKEFGVVKASELIQEIRGKLSRDINQKIFFKYHANPFVFEVSVDDTAMRALIHVLSPKSSQMSKLKKQLKKVSLTAVSKQLGLAFALNDLKKSLTNCFKD